MPIQYCPKVKTVMLCDYSAGGFRHPEMVKRRPVVVINSRLPYRDGLVTVVPLSGSESDPRAKYHCRIELDEELPHPFPAKVWWAKCDMVASVGFERLDYFHTERDHTGKRKYLTGLQIGEPHLEQIREAVRHALGLH